MTYASSSATLPAVIHYPTPVASITARSLAASFSGGALDGK